MAGRYLEAAGWNPKRVDLARFSAEFTREYGVGRDDGSFRRLLRRLAKRHRGKPNRAATKRGTPALRPTGVRAYDGPTRFSPAEEQEIVSVAPDCVIVEHIVDYDTLIRKLDEAFPERRGKWNRDGIRAILKRNGIYDRLLQGERPVPVVVRPPSDALEHLKLQKKVLEQRMDRVRDEFATLDRAHTRVHLAIEAYETNIGVCGLRDLGAALREFADRHPPEEDDPGGHA